MVVVKGLGGERSTRCMRGGSMGKIRRESEKEKRLTGGKG